MDQNELEHAWRIHERNATFSLEINKGAMEGGNLALRYTLLINGGAAIAVLGFLGALVGQGRVQLGPDVNRIASTLMPFAVGIVAGNLGLGFAYLTNYCIAGHASEMKKNYTDPTLEETKSSKLHRKCSRWFLVLAILCALTGVLSFCYGVWEVKEAVKQLTPVKTAMASGGDAMAGS